MIQKLTQINLSVILLVSLLWTPSELSQNNFYTTAYKTHGITRKVWDYSSKVASESKIGVLIVGQPILSNHPEIDGVYDDILGNYSNYNEFIDSREVTGTVATQLKSSHEMAVATVLGAKPDNGGAASPAWNSVKILGLFDVYHVKNKDKLEELFPGNCVHSYSISCLSVFTELNYRIMVRSYAYNEYTSKATVDKTIASNMIVIQAVNNDGGPTDYVYYDEDVNAHYNPTNPEMYAENVIYVTGNTVTGKHQYNSGYLHPHLPIKQITANADITFASSTLDLINNPWEKGEILGGVSVAAPLVASALALGMSICPEASNTQHIKWLFQGAKESDIDGIALLYVEGYLNVIETECQLQRNYAFPLVFGCTGECADLPKN